MKYKKIMFMLVLAIFIFGAASVCASDVNDTVIASEDTSQLELSAGSELDADNLKTSEKNTILTQTNNDESMSGEIDSEVLGADIGTYSGLSEEIGSGGNIELIHDYYTYDSGSTIEISDDNSVIDGKGAIIDMAGSNKQAFDVSASGVIIKNLTIKNAKYNALGGAILFGRSGTVENCIFTNNSGTSSGGAVYFSNTGTVTNCTFVGNTASREGGAVYFSNTGIVTNCNFTNNKATGTAGEMGRGDGGAVHFAGDGTVTNCNFTGNTATGDDGGAVHFTGDGTVSNCTFVGNTAGRSGGGAVYFSDAGIVTNCNFTNNKATGGSIYGGAIWIYSGTVTNCSFTNHSANYGGAVRMGSGSVENCNFTDNTATRDGGAIWIYSGTVTNCNFTNSSATGAGGAVYFYDNSEVTNCNFIYNVAKSSTLGGGAIFFMISGNVAKCNFTDNSASFGGAVLFGGKGNISNSNFTNNSASNGGGAINMASGSVENCNFTDNKATSSSGGSIWFTGNGDVINCIFTNNSATGDGGAVYFYEGATGRIINCNFVNNTATQNGGAVYFADDSTGSIINCNFADNKATGDYSSGGAIFFVNTGSVTKCNFTNNKATGDYSYCGAIYIYSGTVTNCNFTNNTANYESGAIRFSGSGTVTNCNFTGNTASRNGGAVYFNSNGDVTNCNFTGNTASRNGGAVYFWKTGSVTKCNFTDNSATVNGGAVYFLDTGTVTNCNFTDNTAGYWGGAVYFEGIGNVTNCNFTGNNATTGSAIYFYKYFSSDTLTVSNSTFLNNRANAEALDVVKNDNNITITFTGQNNLLNAIYSREDAEVAFYNVTYWGATGITTVSARLSGSNKAAGQNISVGVVVNGKVVLNEVKVTKDNGMIVLPIIAGENYYISARHDTDSYYTEAEKTISNNTKFNVNVTSKTTNNKTVNITAKSNIYSEFMPGKLLFILPNGTQINATYGANGIWWALHTFDDYGEYKVNASYVGLDNVTVNNGTITINKVNSTITLDNIVLDYGESANVTVTTTGATGITANINGTNVTVINNYTIPISDLAAGNYTLTVTTIPDNDHNPVTATSKITVNKVESTLTVDDIVFDYGNEGSGDVSFTGASQVIANVVNQPSAVVNVNGNKISVSGLAAGTYTLNVTTVPDENHTAVTETSTITVNKINSTLTVNDVELDYGETKNITVTAEGATGITAKIDGVNVTVNGYTIPISGLGAGNHTLTVTTIADDNHNPITKEATITVNKLSTEITLANETLDLKVNDEFAVLANLTPGGAGNPTYSSSNESVVKVSDEGLITALSKGTSTVIVSFAGNDNYTAAQNKTISVTVSLKDASVSAEDITLDVGANATVNVTVVPEGLEVTYVPDNSGVVTVENGVVTAVKEGTAKITLTVGGDGVYALNSTTIAVAVKKIDTSIDVDQSSLDLYVNDNSSVSATLTPADAGNVTFTSTNSSVVTVDSKGNVKAVGAGKANITVSFAGDDKYNAAENKTVTVTVSLKDASVSAEDITLDVGANVTIVSVTSPEGLEVTYVPDNSGVVTVENGVVTAVKEGTAKITLTVGGDGVYAENSTVITITVNKLNTTAEVSIPENITVGDNSTVNVVLHSDATGNVTVKVDGEVVDIVPVKDGTAEPIIPSLSAGNHTVEIAYSGDGKYNPVNETKDITVSKNDVTPEITIPSDIEFGDDATIDVKLPSDAKGNVTLTVDGKVIDTVPVVNGAASVKLPNLNAGNHTAEIAYSGDDKYKSTSKTTTVSVSKDSTKITVANVTATYKVNKYLVITLKDSKGNPLANSTVTVDLNGAKNYTTDENGQVKVKVSNMVPKTYTAKITFTGNDNYLGCDATAKVVVKKATPKITASNKMFKTTTKTKKYTITLKDNTGKAIKNAKVTLKVNGKTYKATTNSKGKATFKITKLNKKGTFKAVITYKGSKYYNKVTKKVNIKVISAWKTISKGSKLKSTVKEIQRALKNNGYYLTAYGHYLKVDGIYWDHTVNAVKQFQKAKGLKVTGKVDEKTAKKLGII